MQNRRRLEAWPPFFEIETPDDGEHTELVYTDEYATDETIRQMLGERRGLNVIRAAEVPDAPPQDDTSGSRPWAKAWLVTWRCEPDACLE